MQASLYDKYIYLKEINDDRFRKCFHSTQAIDRENSKNESANSGTRKQNKKARI